MSFHLARLPVLGSSAGQWLVREVPGAVLLGGRPSGLWAIVQLKITSGRSSGKFVGLQEIWGEDWALSSQLLKLKEDGLLNRDFSSRTQALLFLESQLSQQPSALVEVL